MKCGGEGVKNVGLCKQDQQKFVEEVSKELGYDLPACADVTATKDDAQNVELRHHAQWALSDYAKREKKSGADSEYTNQFFNRFQDLKVKGGFKSPKEKALHLQMEEQERQCVRDNLGLAVSSSEVVIANNYIWIVGEGGDTTVSPEGDVTKSGDEEKSTLKGFFNPDSLAKAKSCLKNAENNFHNKTPAKDGDK